jgi:predicted nucleic acid-binding protein
MADVLIDTNVLVYAHDRGEFVKQQQAIQVLEALQLAGTGRLTAQVLAEFFRVVTKGADPLLTVEQARQQLGYIARTWPVLDVTALIVLEAARGVQEHQLSYYDAQVWATARLSQIPIIFSEDFDDGSVIEGVRSVNPFAAGFRLETWV